MNVVCIIPARMGSSRFPGKPLMPILGKPMIEHVYKRVSASKSLADVFVATCDEEIAEAVSRFGGKVLMTSSAHIRASERVAEAAANVECDVVVMVQGDEPMIRPEMIDEALEPMHQDPHVECVNLSAPIRTRADFLNPNTIKVVLAANGDALYFSRAPVPYEELVGFRNIAPLKQVCVIPFRQDMLQRYAKLPQTPHEIAESVDMMRLVENGYRVRVVPTSYETQAVDVPADVAVVEAALQAETGEIASILRAGAR